MSSLFWIIIPCQLSSWQVFSHSGMFSLHSLLPLLCRDMVRCSLIVSPCQCVPSYSKSHWLSRILTCSPIEDSATLHVWSILSCSMEDRGLVYPVTDSQLLITAFPLMYTSKHLCQEWIISGSSVFSLFYMWVNVLLSRHNYHNIQFEALLI